MSAEVGRECAIELPAFHPKQQLAFDSVASEVLFAGDTRAGKSYFIRRAYIVWCSQIPGLQCDIFRLHYDDVIGENMTGETSFPILLANWSREGLCKVNADNIRFWNDSAIYLEHCNDDVVMQKHQGIARHVRTFGESCQILEHRIRALTGWVTMSTEMQSRVPEKWRGQFPKVFHVTNTKGISRSYYRRNFVDARPPYSIEKIGQFNRQYIPAFLDDNPSEDQEATRARIKEAFTDVETQKSLINEDKTGITNWHTGAGEFFTMWDAKRHVVKDFIPPPHWFRYRSMDIGWHEPTAVYWIAVSDGQVFRDGDGNERWFPRGARVFYGEWYICNAETPAQGLNMRNEDIADGILARSEHDAQKVATLTDSKPFQGMGGEHPALTFQKRGVVLTQVNTGPGSRVAGWSVMAGALVGQDYDAAPGKLIKLPMLYFTECCKYAIDYIPALPRHPSEGKKDDAAEHGEATHSCDSVRYGMVGHPIIQDAVQPMESRVAKELEVKRPTIKSVIGGSDHRRIWAQQ